MIRIAVLGSAFNPPTLGHKDVIAQCLKANCFDEVLLVPSIAHAFGKKMAPFEDRAHWLALFLKDLKEDKAFNLTNTPIYISLCEEMLFKKAHCTGSVCTYDVLNFLKADFEQKKQSNISLTFVIGPDNKANLHKFKHSNQLQNEFSFFIAQENLNIRSTQLRQALIAEQDISAYTTKRVRFALLNASKPLL